ncbi:MAG: MCP four helix bundle domain-containing protein, partial [Pseudomonadota bacterium]
MKIKFRILLPSIVSILLMLVLSGAGYFVIHTLQNHFDDLASRNLRNITAANNIRGQLLEANSNAYRLISWIANFDEGRIKQEVGVINAKIDGALSLIKEMQTSSGIDPESEKTLVALNESTAKYKKSIRQAIEMAESDASAGAGMMQSADKHYQSIVNNLAQLLEIQQQDVSNAVSAAERESSQANWLTLVMLAIAISASVALSFWVTRSILRQLGGEPAYVSEVVQKVAAGDLTVHVETRNGDTSSMLHSVKNMVAKLGQIIGEVRSSADALGSASEEVSATAQNMSQATSEQAASVEETSASVEQM